MDRDVSAGLDDLVEGAAVHDQVLDHREGLCAEGLDIDRIAVLEVAHMELADRGLLPRAVRNAVHDLAAHAADAFAAVAVKGDGLARLCLIRPSFTTSSISRKDMSEDDVRCLVTLELAFFFGAFLTPDV